MANSRASIRDRTFWLAAGAIALAACGRPAATQPIENKVTPMAATATAPSASDLATQAQAALDKGDATQANTLFDRALAALGTSYHRDGTIDDTGMKLTLANAEAKRGNLDTAATMKARVIESRLALAAQPR